MAPTAILEVAYLLGELTLLVRSTGIRQRHPAGLETLTSKRTTRHALRRARNAVTACILHILTTEQHAKCQTSMQTKDAWSGAYPVTVAGVLWNCVFIYVILRNAVYAFNDRVLSHLKESREQSSCLTTFILSANSADISLRSTSLFLAVFVVSLEQPLVRDAVSLFKTSFSFFLYALMLFQNALTLMFIQLQVNAKQASTRLWPFMSCNSTVQTV